MKKHIAILFVIAGSLSTVSCIGGGGALTADSAPQIMTTFATLVGQLPKGNKTATLPSDLNSGGVTVSSLEMKASPRLSCESSTPASPVDADGDGIALLKQYTFNCSSYVGSGYTYNHLGTFKSIDNNDSVPGLKGGYRFEFDIPTWTSTEISSDLTSGGSYSGYWEGSGTDTTSEYKSDYHGSYYADYDIASLGKVSVDYDFSHQFDVKYTHNSTAVGANWSSGSMEATGAFMFDGQFVDEDSNGVHRLKNGQATMTWKTENVTFDSGCAKWYKTGRFLLTDTGGNKLRTEFNCTEVKVYFNDKELDGNFW